MAKIKVIIGLTQLNMANIANSPTPTPNVFAWYAPHVFQGIKTEHSSLQ